MSLDPRIGRWISEDPIGFQAADANLYRYVGNNPTNLTDPHGLAAPPVVLAWTTIALNRYSRGNDDIPQGEGSWETAQIEVALQAARKGEWYYLRLQYRAIAPNTHASANTATMARQYYLRERTNTLRKSLLEPQQIRFLRPGPLKTKPARGAVFGVTVDLGELYAPYRLWAPGKNPWILKSFEEDSPTEGAGLIWVQAKNDKEKFDDVQGKDRKSALINQTIDWYVIYDGATLRGDVKATSLPIPDSAKQPLILLKSSYLHSDFYRNNKPYPDKPEPKK